MAELLCEGAVIACSFGSAPVPMVVPPETPVLLDGRPGATILAFAPLENIPTFGLCESLANPEVEAATVAADGVLTPMPCLPATTAPWVPGAPRVLVEGVPALRSGSLCLCDWLGEITIEEPGQVRAGVGG